MTRDDHTDDTETTDEPDSDGECAGESAE